MAAIPDRVLVLGLARSGRAAVTALRAQGANVTAHDTNPDLDGAVVDADVHLGAWDDALLDGVDLVVKSPGIPGHAPPVTAALARDIPVISEIELGARLLENPIIGITGTNGKTTTTALLGAMFDAAGVPAEVAGNIGRPLTGLVGTASPDSWVVCELSSFQLEDIETLHCRIGVLLNLEPDHLDRHGSFEDYRDAKLRIFERQTAGDLAILPRGFGAVPGEGRRLEFDGGDELPAEPLIPGAHNRENAVAATAAARAAGVPETAIAEALRTFPGVEHRIEEVATIAGVRYVNDSKATNVAAALARARVVPRRTEARDPGRARQGRAVFASRRGVRCRRPRLSDRRGDGGDCCRARGCRRRVRALRRPCLRSGRRRRGSACRGHRAALAGVR